MTGLGSVWFGINLETWGPGLSQHGVSAVFACISTNGHNPIFDIQKRLQGRRQARRQFLPCQQLTSSPNNCPSHTAHNAVPVLDQVGPPFVKQGAEVEVKGMSRENVAYELIGDVSRPGPGKLLALEYLVVITVLLDKFSPLNLEISFRQFRFK